LRFRVFAKGKEKQKNLKKKEKRTGGRKKNKRVLIQRTSCLQGGGRLTGRAGKRGGQFQRGMSSAQ